MQVRPCVNAEEMRAAFAPIWHYFGQNPPSEDAVKHFHRVLPPERVHAGFDGDSDRRRARRRFAFDLTMPGGQVKAAGVTVVGVLPTHRRRGYLRAMMRSLHRCSARARRAGRGAVGDGRHDLRPVRLRHGLDGGRDRCAARAHGAVRGNRRAGRRRGSCRLTRPSR